MQCSICKKIGAGTVTYLMSLVPIYANMFIFTKERYRNGVPPQIERWVCATTNTINTGNCYSENVYGKILN